MTLASRPATLGDARLEGVHVVTRGLYAIVDVTRIVALGLEPLAFAQAVLVARPAALQVRAKELEARELLALLRAVGSLCRTAGVAMVANDRVDLAVLAGCGYVHVGQTDLSVERVHRVAPTLGVGVSTHTPEQLAQALLTRPDYVAYGPVFATASKVDADPPVGLEGLGLASSLARVAGVPLVAIGGVTLETAADIALRADAGAAIQALLPTGEVESSGPRDVLARYEEVTARAVALHAALGGSPGAPVVRA